MLSETSPSTAAATAPALFVPEARSTTALEPKMVAMPTVIARAGARSASKSAALTLRVLDAAGLRYGRFVALALGLGIDSSPFWDEDTGWFSVDEPVEVLLHVDVVAGLVIRPQLQILVEVEEGGPGEG